MIQLQEKYANSVHVLVDLSSSCTVEIHKVL